MAVIKKEIARRTKGSLQEKEDWWYVCYDADTGQSWVEHEWDHMNAYKLGKDSNSGTEKHSVDEWIEGRRPGYEKIIEVLDGMKARP